MEVSPQIKMEVEVSPFQIIPKLEELGPFIGSATTAVPRPILGPPNDASTGDFVVSLFKDLSRLVNLGW